MFNFNLKFIEKLRNREELVSYFKSLGQDITEKEIETLKKAMNKLY